MKNTAIILAGGSGTRMHCSVPKQYIEFEGRPLLYYTIKAFQTSSVIDDIILVAADKYIEYCELEIVDKYHFSKVTDVVRGGSERYDSVVSALKAVRNDGYVFIHDGARPCISENDIRKCYESVLKYNACVVAAPVKDTIKVADKDGFVEATPDRSTLWQIQTPQAFEVNLIKNAYQEMLRDENKGNITDDSMIVEKYTDIKVKIVKGSYNNIKITTPEDLEIMKLFINNS